MLVRAHVEAKKAWDLGASETQMKDILMGIRHAQWRWDYVAASHGGSFHSPVESSRIISTGITTVQETRLKLARLFAEFGFNEEVPYPDISTKANLSVLVNEGEENTENAELIQETEKGDEAKQYERFESQMTSSHRTFDYHRVG